MRWAEVRLRSIAHDSGRRQINGLLFLIMSESIYSESVWLSHALLLDLFRYCSKARNQLGKRVILWSLNRGMEAYFL